jgi:hypothetical protein
MILGINDLPPETKKAFEELTMIEEMLIAPLISIMSIFRLPGGQLISRGFVANFSQDIQPICDLLPRLPDDLPILILKKKDQNNNVKQFIVCRERVRICLEYLTQHNRFYIDHGIKINISALKKLPIDGVPSNLNEVEDQDISPGIENILLDNGPVIVEKETLLDEPYETFVASEQNEPLQVDYIKQKINWPTSNSAPINEWTQNGMASLLFPKLFPNGKGDPTNKSRQIEVSETQAINHLIKVVANNSKNEQYYPIASHPRFKFWYYDRLRRHRSLEQCKIYMTQHKEDANLTIKQLKELITNDNSKQFMKKMTSYAANITGSDAYWSRRRSELEATFEQAKTASAFFTFSYPDLHWEDLQRMMPGPLATTFTEKYKKILDNPHLVDWFFSYKLNEFLKTVFDDVLECEWRWHR